MPSPPWLQPLVPTCVRFGTDFTKVTASGAADHCCIASAETSFTKTKLHSDPTRSCVCAVLYPLALLSDKREIFVTHATVSDAAASKPYSIDSVTFCGSDSTCSATASAPEGN